MVKRYFLILVIWSTIKHRTMLQGLYRSLKTWKVLEFENLDSKPGKSWNIFRSPWKSWIYISNHKCTGIQALHFFRNMGVSLCVKSLWIHWKGPWIWHWKVLESPGIWNVKMCMNSVLFCFVISWNTNFLGKMLRKMHWNNTVCFSMFLVWKLHRTDAFD